MLQSVSQTWRTLGSYGVNKFTSCGNLVTMTDNTVSSLEQYFLPTGIKENKKTYIDNIPKNTFT